MAELLTISTDPITQSEVAGTAIAGSAPAAANEIQLVVMNVIVTNPAALGTIVLVADDGPSTPIPHKVIYDSSGYRATVVWGNPGSDITQPGFFLTVGANAGQGTWYYRGQYLTFSGVTAEDGDLSTNPSFQSVLGNADPIALSATAANSTDMVVAVGGSYDTTAPSPTFAAPFAANTQELVQSVGSGRGLTSAVSFLSGVAGAQAVSFDGAAGTGFGLMTFVFRGASNTISFNCECEDADPEKSLAAYRRDILIRAGFAAVASNPPPGVADLIDTFLRDAQMFLYRKYPALRTRRFFRWALEEGVRYYGMRENNDGDARQTVTISVASPAVVTFPAAPLNGRKVSFSVSDGGTLPSPLLAGVEYFAINRTSTTCQLALTPGGTALATTSSGSGVFTAHGVPFPGCIFNMDPYKNIEGAWVVDLNGAWLPLVEGIPPTFYTTASQPSLPSRYEIRQCVEVFPAPSATGYQLYIKGHFGLQPFELDGDKPTINGHLVYLWALANALDYYGKPSAAGIATQANDYLGQLVAGTHGSRRYVPGTRALPPAVQPVPLPFPGETL